MKSNELNMRLCWKLPQGINIHVVEKVIKEEEFEKLNFLTWISNDRIEWIKIRPRLSTRSTH